MATETNDAPTIVKADMGIAMGVMGSEVIRSACDVELLSNDFCSILSFCRLGRNFYENIRKYLEVLRRLSGKKIG